MTVSFYLLNYSMSGAKTSGFVPVFAALVGNMSIAVMKWLGFFASGSGSMFSEAVHSVADVINQLLLMVGIRRSKRPSSEEYPYGYGNERFFWATISACSIFFVGAGVTVYRGVQTLFSTETVHIDPVIFIILAVSFVTEAGTFLLALKELRKADPKKDLAYVLENGDPTTIAVLYEDGVALLGVAVAFVGIFLTYVTGKTYWDAVGSIVIGVLLGIMAVILINKNRLFLLRKSIPEEIAEKVIGILESDPAIEKVIDFKTGILDVGVYHIKCEVEFNGSALMRLMYRTRVLQSEYVGIKDDYDEFLRFCVNYADRMPRMIGNRIDDVERRIMEEIPEVRHIDIEVN